MLDLKRRQFVTLLGGTAATWPFAARAQQKLPTIGFLGANSPAVQRQWTAAFVQRLRELGWTEGHNLAIEYRWAEGRFDRSPAIIAEFVRLKVDAALMANVGVANAVLEISEVQAAARTLGLDVATFEIRQTRDIEPAIEAFKNRAEALYVQADPLFTSNRLRINTLALGARLPTMHGTREQVDAGGLISYGTNLTDLCRRAGDYVDKILRGAKPADLPVEQPTKFDLVINLITAKALGLTVPPTLLARADEVIE